MSGLHPVCPVCRGELAPTGEGGFSCTACGADFPSARGIPCLFPPETGDFWAESQRTLEEFFGENPALSKALEAAPPETLNGADLSAKASLLRIQGRFREAVEVHEASWARCYPQEYRDSFQAQMDFITESLKSAVGPVLDIASGRGTLISQLLSRVEAPLIASDLSPTVLADYQASRWGEHLQSGRLGLMAFDAKNIPFEDGAVPVITTCLGLQNIPGPEAALRELRRVCGGTLYAMCMFFPEEDGVNHKAAAKVGLPGAFSLEQLRGMMERCGWQVRPEAGPWFQIQPTPEGEIAAGMRVDALPARETRCRFATLVCQ